MKLNRILGLLAVVLLAGVVSSCSDDCDVSTATPLPGSEMSAKDIAYNSLTFSWNKIEGARQYSYRLTKTSTETIILTGLTKETQVTFTDLEYDTEYTLTLLAYAQVYSDRTTSDPIVLTARTSDLITIESPVITWSREVNTLIFTWNPVVGARDYIYTIKDADGNEVASGTTFESMTSMSNCRTTTYTIDVVARTITDGYRDSQPGIATVDFVRQREEIWRTNGLYTSSLLDKSWSAAVVAYDDSTYTILSWYGVEGYNLEFKLDENNAANIFQLNGDYTTNTATGSFEVPTGTTLGKVNVHATDNKCAFEGNAGKGSIVLAVSTADATGTDRLEWGVSIDDFVGSWNLSFAGYDKWGDSSYDAFDSGAVTITKGEAENTLVIPMPYYDSYTDGIMVVDMDNMTFTVQPVAGKSYTFAGVESDTAPMTGTISLDKIEFSPIGIWYSGSNFIDSEKSYLRYTRE